MACDSVPDHPQVVNGGFPDQQTLAAWMARAWVFLYPSLYEGFGIPYVEAMASGTAIVTSPNSGADYVLEHGRYGLIRGDAEIGDALISLLEDPQRRHAMAQDGLQHVGRFTWAEVSRQHVGFYERAIGIYARNPARPAA
jgi:glycosyltransferase involved in cell wall biosynthesis